MRTMLPEANNLATADEAVQVTELLAELLARRSAVRDYHRTCRAGQPDPELLLPNEREALERFKKSAAWKLGPHGIMPPYVAHNLTQRIAQTRHRLAALLGSGRGGVE
jgi:hypothetical protein